MVSCTSVAQNIDWKKIVGQKLCWTSSDVPESFCRYARVCRVRVTSPSS